MRKIAMIALPITIFVAGLLFGIFALGGQNSAQASVPQQEAPSGEGWTVQSFNVITFEADRWTNIGQVGSCITYKSLSTIIEGVKIPSSINVVTGTGDFKLVYPNRGSRVTVCAGFTAFFPPLSSGIVPTEEEP